MNNATLDLYSEGATLSKCIHEGRPTTTKPTFVALPSLTSHSTFYECSRGILCQPQASPHSPLTRLGVIISYSLHLERKITLSLIQKSFRPTLLRAKWRTNTATIRHPQQRKLHQQLFKARATRVSNVKSIG